jgi:hypothetical protein
MYVLFVDETGCNTNQKDDGHVGGKLFVLPTDDSDVAPIGATDIHFTLFAFFLEQVNLLCVQLFSRVIRI